MPHLPREAFKARMPQHVTICVKRGVWNLRSQRCFNVLARAFWTGGDRFDFRLVHYSIQGNHIHLLTEARGKKALARGMKGLGVRIAKHLNKLMQRRGRVLGDRYHSRLLKTPTEVKRVRHYLLDNGRKHHGIDHPDPYASQTPLYVPESFLTRLALPPD